MLTLTGPCWLPSLRLFSNCATFSNILKIVAEMNSNILTAIIGYPGVFTITILGRVAQSVARLTQDT